MDHAGSLSGRRVRWVGPAQHGGLSPRYLAEFRTGQRRPPRPDELLELRPGDTGTIGEPTSVGSGGQLYAIDFDNGYRLETTLSPSLVQFLELAPTQVPAEVPNARRYAPTRRPHRAALRWLLPHRGRA